MSDNKQPVKKLVSLLDEQPVEHVQEVCPACGHAVIQEKCKVVCRSHKCVYRIVLNCSEF